MAGFQVTTHGRFSGDHRGLCDFREVCPHSGQSSQLSVDAHGRNAQFLATSAGKPLNLPTHFESLALALKYLRVQRVIVTAHSGQSSQLAFDAQGDCGEHLTSFKLCSNRWKTKKFFWKVSSFFDRKTRIAIRAYSIDVWWSAFRILKIG